MTGLLAFVSGLLACVIAGFSARYSRSTYFANQSLAKSAIDATDVARTIANSQIEATDIARRVGESQIASNEASRTAYVIVTGVDF